MDQDYYISSNYKDGISFFYFKNILEQFDPECPLLEVATLYRLAWVFGNNVVNLDSFLIAAHQRNFFIRNMKIDGVYSFKDQEFYKELPPAELQDMVVSEYNSKYIISCQIYNFCTFRA